MKLWEFPGNSQEIPRNLPPMMAEEKLTIWIMSIVAGVYLVSLAWSAVFNGI